MTDWKDKVLSGRFLLTLITGFTFFFCATGWLTAEGTALLTPSDIKSLITIVFICYFNRQRDVKPPLLKEDK